MKEAAGAAAGYGPFTFYAASGMGAVGFASLVTLVLVGPAQWQPIVAPLLVAMRPEGALVADSMWRLLGLLE